jgi:3',5'-nucleoside bisphosphate phosphatase
LRPNLERLTGDLMTTDARYCDLHCHSTASDGSLPPTEVVQLAQRSGVSAMSLTDHDTVAGVPEAAAEAARLGIDFVSGIEISCEFRAPGTLHLLGYGVDPQSEDLQALTRQLIEARDNRNPRMIAKLNEVGVAVTMDEWEQEAGGDVVGRPHLAQILVRKGYVSSVKNAFDKYLGQGGLAYFDKERLAPRQAFDLVRQAGGLPVLAHPIQLRTENDAQLERVVKDLVDLGLAGIEVMHSDHTPELVEKYTKLADRHGLLKTGGSDFHGQNKKDIELGVVNKQRVPRQFMDALLAQKR